MFLVIMYGHTFDKNLRLDPEISVTGNYNLGIPIQRLIC